MQINKVNDQVDWKNNWWNWKRYTQYLHWPSQGGPKWHTKRVIDKSLRHNKYIKQKTWITVNICGGLNHLSPDFETLLLALEVGMRYQVFIITVILYPALWKYISEGNCDYFTYY